MLAMKLIVCNVTTSFVDIKKTPYVGEVGSKRARKGLQRRTKVIPKEFGQDKNYAAQQQVDGDVDKRRHDGAMSQTTMQSHVAFSLQNHPQNWTRAGRSPPEKGLINTGTETLRCFRGRALVPHFPDGTGFASLIRCKASEWRVEWTLIILG